MRLHAIGEHQGIVNSNLAREPCLVARMDETCLNETCLLKLSCDGCAGAQQVPFRCPV